MRGGGVVEGNERHEGAVVGEGGAVRPARPAAVGAFGVGAPGAVVDEADPQLRVAVLGCVCRWVGTTVLLQDVPEKKTCLSIKYVVLRRGTWQIDTRLGLQQICCHFFFHLDILYAQTSVILYYCNPVVNQLFNTCSDR